MPEGVQADDPGALRAWLRADLITAMKARQRETVAALRSTLAAIDNAEAVDVSGSTDTASGSPIAGARAGVGSSEVERRVLTLEEVRVILEAQVTERLEAAEGYNGYGQHEMANELRREASALGKYVEAPESASVGS